MHNVKLLIVDDDEDDYLLTRDLIEEIAGGSYALEWAPTYEQGEQILRRNHHHLCLMDYKLGARDGIELLKSAHALGFTGPIILLTGMDQGEVDMQALQAGAVDYLVKANLSAEQLARAIRYALARREVEQERVERLKAEAENRSKSEFLAHLSHELRTPLSAILGFTELLMHKNKEAETLSHLRVVHRNGKHLLGLLNDILDFSKIEAGKLELDLQRVHLASFLTDVYALMQGAALDKNLQLRLEAPEPLPQQIRTDATRLRQILLNLIGNAIKFTDCGEVVTTVRMHRVDDCGMVRFSVRDTGAGIRPEALRSIFQPFVQSSGASSQSHIGTGLGLTISRQLVKRLGGEIEVSSVLGRGSEFTFSIDPGDIADQLWEDFPLDVSVEHETMQVVPQFAGRVLVVDDLRDIRLLIGHIVQAAGLEVHFASNGEEALRLIVEWDGRGNGFDVVLMDIHMPVMGGLEAAQRLRDNGFSKPLIALTAAHMKGDRDRFLECGFSAYVSKPIDQYQLHTCLAQFLSAEAVGAGRRSNHDEALHSGIVLVVDDSRDALTATSGLLSLLGWKVITASDAAQAIAEAQKHRPCRVLVDLNLPDMDGYTVCAIIRKVLPSAKVIIASGEEVEQARAGEAGMTSSLLKPLSLDALEQALR